MQSQLMKKKIEWNVIEKNTDLGWRNGESLELGKPKTKRDVFLTPKTITCTDQDGE